MKRTHLLEPSLAAAAVVLAFAPMIHAHAQDDSATREVRDAENELERAEERLDQAEEAVEAREDALQDAIADAADSADADSERSVEARDTDWDALTDEHPNLSTFVEALRLTGLGDTLAGGTDYTVFAPVDE